MQAAYVNPTSFVQPSNLTTNGSERTEVREHDNDADDRKGIQAQISSLNTHTSGVNLSSHAGSRVNLYG